ncbi:MAG: DUF5681 domain-containing protein [Devosia sp.]
MAPLPAKIFHPKLKTPDRSGYEVGYGKPPAGTRFKSGQSGNPKGRHKGSKNKLPALNEERLKSIILEEAYRSIKINEGDKQISVPMAQAIMRSLAVNAVKGQHRSQRLFSELLSATETQNRQFHDEWMDVAMTYKIEWERELDRRARLGITGLPEPLPHPDHVVIDIRNGTAIVRGPATKEEKAEWDMWMSRKADSEAELVELNDLLATPGYRYKKTVREEIAQTEKVLAIIARIIG